jgi:hypothetical protein
LLEPINRTLEGYDSLRLLHISFAFPRVGLVCHKLFLISNQMREGDGDLYDCSEFYSVAIKKLFFGSWCAGSFSL